MILIAFMENGKLCKIVDTSTSDTGYVLIDVENEVVHMNYINKKKGV